MMGIMRIKPFHIAAVRDCVLLLCVLTASSVASAVSAQTVGGWMATPMAQANGVKVRTPLARPISRYSKLSLTVDTRWTNNFGYLPIQATVTSPKPTTADHSITVRLHNGWADAMVVEQQLELPAGSVSASATIAVPQYQRQTQFFWWEVWVDGMKDKDLSLKKEDAARTIGGGFNSSSGLCFLAIGPANAARTLVAPNTFEFEVLTLPASEFPTRWIEYTCIDVMTLTADELQSFPTTNARAFEAMRHWLNAGGQLWISEVGKWFEKLPDVSKLMRLRQSVDPTVIMDAENNETNTSKTKQIRVTSAGWQPVRFRNGNPEGQVVTFLHVLTGETRVERDPAAINQLQNDPNFSVVQQQYETAGDRPQRRWPRDTGEWFVEQRYGLGSVRAFRESSEVSLFHQRPLAANPNVALNEESASRMPRSLSMALRSAERWDARHGTAPDSANYDFANLLVPGVGLAPVTEFRVLITLFVLAIGPLNYWLLKRWRRMHLLVLTVPLAAALMTAALFGYAIVADGFGTTVRAHSFTTLDQRTGEAACWARISYYAGLAPGDGLTMPNDIALYPIIPAWNANRFGADLGVSRFMRWDGNEAKLTAGWLRSRTPTQYLTVRARKSPHRLELAEGGGRLRATNKLGTAIEFVLVFDSADKILLGEKLADGSVAFLQPIERAEAVKRFRRIVTENEPQPPPALSDGNSHFAVMQRRQRRQIFTGQFGMQSSEARLSTNRVNESLAELVGLLGAPALALPPRSYVAITATGPEVEFGLRGAEEEASFHVIVGKW